MNSLSYQINKKLENYVKNNIIPQYKKNEKAHRENHINYVIRRSFELIEQNNLEVNSDMVYVIAAYHDIGHHIDAKNHEKVSADIMKKVLEFENSEGLGKIYTYQDEMIHMSYFKNASEKIAINDKNSEGADERIIF